MADDFFYSQEILSRKKKLNVNRILIACIIILTLVLVAELVFHLLIAPKLTIKKIVLDSEIEISSEELIRIAGISPNEFYFALDEMSVKSSLESWPQVLEAEVEKTFPDTLRISLKKRIPLAVIIVDTQDGSRAAVLDEEGVLFEKYENCDVSDLPVISGIKFESFHTGSRLPAELYVFLEDLSKLYSQRPQLLSLFSEFHIQRTGQQGYSVTAFPESYQISIKIGSRIDEELCTYIMLVLNVLENQDILNTISELDFRTDNVIYRMKGGAGGV